MVNEYVQQAIADELTRARIDQGLKDKWCLERIDSGDSRDAEPYNSPSDFDWYNQSLYRDTPNTYYLAVASWRWFNDSFIDNDVVVCVNNQVGGLDGVGLRLSGGEYLIHGYSASAWGNPGKNSYDDDCGTMSLSASSVSQYGVGFRGQDSTKTLRMNGWCNQGVYDYSMYQGVMSLTFNALNGGCRTAQMFTDYAHTWDSTSINSIGAGPWSFNVGWVNSGSQWEDSESGPSGTVC